jgi:hypothetical protein
MTAADNSLQADAAAVASKRPETKDSLVRCNNSRCSTRAMTPGHLEASRAEESAVKFRHLVHHKFDAFPQVPTKHVAIQNTSPDLFIRYCSRDMMLPVTGDEAATTTHGEIDKGETIVISARDILLPGRFKPKSGLRRVSSGIIAFK